MCEMKRTYAYSTAGSGRCGGKLFENIIQVKFFPLDEYKLDKIILYD